MEANVVTEHVVVRERPDGISPVVAELTHGLRITLGEATFKRAWVEVTLTDGRVGHVRGEVKTRSEPLAHCVVVGEPMRLRAVRDMGEEPTVTIPEGQIIASGAPSNAQYMSWTEIALADGTLGYIPGEPRAQRIVWSQLAQRRVIIRSAPNLSGAQVRTIEDGSIIGIGPTANVAQHPWLRAVMPDGADGFVPPDTHITRLDSTMRLRRLLTFPGRCANCDHNGAIRIVNLHLAEARSGKFIGDCFVPICSRCISVRFYVNSVLLFLAGTGTILTTALTGHDLLGAIGYVPFGFYSMNAAHKGGTVRRYRRVAQKATAKTIDPRRYESIALTYQQEMELDEVWPSLSKWIVCPRCLRLERHQSAWCPECRYMFPWRFGPRP